MSSREESYTSLRSESETKLDRKLNPVSDVTERRIHPFNFDTVVEYSGQQGDRFEMKHRLSGGQGLSIFKDQQADGTF